jgi:hypothetical protein
LPHGGIVRRAIAYQQARKARGCELSFEQIAEHCRSKFAATTAAMGQSGEPLPLNY